MAPSNSIRPDGTKILELIKVWDHGCATPRNCPHRRGATTRFARRLGRHPQSFWNLKNGYGAGEGFLTHIADVLGVPLKEITLAGDEQEQPEVPALPEVA
jgi:hypothetical protein